MANVLICIVVAICFIVVTFFIAIQPISTNIKTWCETRKHISDNKKEIEFRRLQTLEKTPELRQLIFHPKTLEKDEK
jgi:predicted PurR-regulated permease PerM